LKIAVAVERREKRLVEEEEEEAEEDLEDSVYMGSMLRWAKAGVLVGARLLFEVDREQHRFWRLEKFG